MVLIRLLNTNWVPLWHRKIRVKIDVEGVISYPGRVNVCGYRT